MKNEIEKLDLLYGVTIFHILNKYEEFKLLKLNNQKKLAIIINEWLKWLETQKNVNALNVIEVTKILLDDNKIRNNILKNDNRNLNINSLDLLKELQFDELNDIAIEKNNMFINKENKLIFYKKKNSQEIIDNELYSSNLLFRDIIELLILNFNFKRKIEHIGNYNSCLEFLNDLNIILYKLYDFLHLNRSDLYYCSLFFLNNRYVSLVLFPSHRNITYSVNSAIKESSHLINNIVSRGLHYINKYYYIEIPQLEYNNKKRSIPYCKNNDNNNFFSYILEKLDSKQKIFLIKISTFENSYKLTKQEYTILEDIINIYKQDTNLVIRTQKTNDIIKNLINKNAIGVSNYCSEKNLIVENYVFSLQDQEATSSQEYLSFYINYNHFKYKFVIRKYNSQLSWQVYLKNKKIYKIKLLLEDDYRHIIQAMLQD